MKGYGTGKIILKFPHFCQLNEENQERENSKLGYNYQQMRCIGLCFFLFEFLALEILCLKIRNSECNFKTFFPVLYPYHIYNRALN